MFLAKGTATTLTVCDDGQIVTTVHTSDYTAHLQLIGTVLGKSPHNDYCRRIAREARTLLNQLEDEDQSFEPVQKMVADAISRLDLGTVFLVQRIAFADVLEHDIAAVNGERPLTEHLLKNARLRSKPHVLVAVRGGVAEIVETTGDVDAEIVDFDNLQDALSGGSAEDVIKQQTISLGERAINYVRTHDARAWETLQHIVVEDPEAELSMELAAGQRAQIELARHGAAMGCARFAGKQVIADHTWLVQARILSKDEVASQADAMPLAFSNGYTPSKN